MGEEEKRVCIMDFNRFKWYHLPVIDAVLKCESQVSGRCVCDGSDCDRIVDVIGLKDEEVNEILEKEKWIQLTDRFFTTKCGVINRVYLVNGEKILVSHDMVGYTGGHVIVFEKGLIDEIKRFVEVRSLEWR